MNPITVNGRQYAPPRHPVVVVCVDGFEPAYLQDGIARGVLPNLARFAAQGFSGIGDCAMPSFTNPNNLAIVTGVAPAEHGISGNYFLDPDSGEEVMMNDPAFLRCGTLLAAFSQAGAKVAVVTAKDKLRGLLGHGLRDGICFSAEKADEATLETHGIADVPALLGLPVPNVYSAALSEFVMAAGLHLLRNGVPDLLYLSTTDYVQHKAAPGSAAADAFHAMLDRYLGEFDRLGATVGVTADHGMNAKADAQGQPQVVYLQPLLDEWLGRGRARVILPITDPYVVHHGALGSFATVYLEPGIDPHPLVSRLMAQPGIRLVGTRAQAAARLRLPPDRIGDLVVIGTTHVVLGKSPEAHDLSGLTEPLRSHGGLSERSVPVLLNRPLPERIRIRTRYMLRNFDIFDLALNHALV